MLCFLFFTVSNIWNNKSNQCCRSGLTIICLWISFQTYPPYTDTLPTGYYFKESPKWQDCQYQGVVWVDPHFVLLWQATGQDGSGCSFKGFRSWSFRTHHKLISGRLWWVILLMPYRYIERSVPVLTFQSRISMLHTESISRGKNMPA